MCIERQRGLTLIELIVFILIVGVALAGVLTVLNITTRHSADPMIRKQALAIAEAVLEEVMLQPFTWCDPDDTNAATATAYAGCADTNLEQNKASAKTGEARGSASPLDNVFDYNGATINTNIAAGGSAVYNASVTVAAANLNDLASGDGTALLITVTVSGGGESITLHGYRTRHSPNSLP